MNKANFNFITEPDLLEEIEKTGKRLTFVSGDVLVQPEKYIKVIPLLIRGTVKVMRFDSKGHELFLYYITSGQSCAVSLSTCLTDKLSNIKAIVEEETELIAIPALEAARWFEIYPGWRSFVLLTMNDRFDELIKTVDQIAFSKIDDRILQLLQTKSEKLGTKQLHITHQEIATELSTSREVVSRLLKHLEKNGRLSLFRNRIELISFR